MIGHFGAIAQATQLPVVIYNIPGRTAANMLPETLLELARRHRNIAGVKESSGDLKQIGMILRDRAEGFIVWSGDDHLFLPCLALGADGVVGVASHLCSREYRAMLDAYQNGRVAEAAQIHASLLPLIDALFATTSPIPVKWAMRQLGFDVGSCRLPLDEMPENIADRLRPFLAAYASHAVESR
jgi:4-hydroxy-tetrahydrodipicolinate synthase